MKYYVMLNGQQEGPFELEELPAKGVRPSTYVWCKGMPDWEKAEDVADVCRLFRNRLYDLMHPQSNPSALQNGISSGSDIYKNEVSDNLPASPTRFDKILNNAGQPSLPTLEEIDSRENTEIPPMSMVGYAWVVTILCFPPTGVAALIYAYKSKESWRIGNHKEAYLYNRAAKMWTGISFFLGFILYAALIRFA